MTTKAKLVLSLIGAVVLAANVTVYLMVKQPNFGRDEMDIIIGYVGIAFAAFVVVFVVWMMWQAIRDGNKSQKELL